MPKARRLDLVAGGRFWYCAGGWALSSVEEYLVYTDWRYGYSGIRLHNSCVAKALRNESEKADGFKACGLAKNIRFKSTKFSVTAADVITLYTQLENLNIKIWVDGG